MKKWILSMLSIMCMVMLWTPMVAAAEEDWTAVKSVKVAGLELNGTTPYYHNGANGAQGTVDANAEGANATFDAATGTLTLNNLNINSDQKGIFWEYKYDGAHDLTIVLAEDSVNTITCTAATESMAINGASGFSSGGPSLIIEGNGTLNLKGNSHAIWVWENIIIQDAVKLHAEASGDACICNNNRNGAFTIKEDAVVEIIGRDYAIGYSNYNENSPIIQGGTLIMTAETSVFRSAPNLEENTKWQIFVGANESEATRWNGITELDSEDYKYAKLESDGNKIAISGTATITGEAKEGKTLTAELENINLAEDERVTLAYQWKRNGEAIGAKSLSNTYVVTADDLGKAITVEVSTYMYSGSVISEAVNVEIPHVCAPTIVKAVSATCTESGKDAYYHCEECGKNYVDAQGTNEIADLTAWGNKEALGHNCIWYISKDATETEKGEMTGKCTVCNYTATVETPVVAENGSGDVLVVFPETNANKAQIINADTVKKVIPLTDEERNAVVSGNDLSIILETKDITTTVATEEKAKLEENLGDFTSGMYMDISLWKQVGTGQKVYVSETTDKVKISLVIPENLRAGSDVTRTYKVHKLHNGTVTGVEMEYDAANNQLTFETDEFSTYMLSYKDTKNTPQVTPPATDDTNNVPKTGDASNIYLWMILMLLGVTSVAYAYVNRRSRIN